MRKGGSFVCALCARAKFLPSHAHFYHRAIECKVLLTDCIAVELANKVCCWLGLLCWTSALPGRSKNCKLEKGIPGGFAPAVSCEGGS